MADWNQKPAIIALAEQAHLLSVRLARLEAAKRLEGAVAILRALTPEAKKS